MTFTEEAYSRNFVGDVGFTNVHLISFIPMYRRVAKLLISFFPS